ncbi:hypothetical protein, partial [Thiolapillus sp.]
AEKTDIDCRFDGITPDTGDLYHYVSARARSSSVCDARQNHPQENAEGVEPEPRAWQEGWHKPAVSQGIANLQDIAVVLKREDADIVALQEADGASLWSGGFDHVAMLAKEAGYLNYVRTSHAVQLRRRFVVPQTVSGCRSSHIQTLTTHDKQGVYTGADCLATGREAG